MQYIVTDLPLHLIELIFTYLPYKQLDSLRCVCKSFHEVCMSRMTTGIEALLGNLQRKMSILEHELKKPLQSLEDKIALNQTYTTLKLLRIHVYTLYVLRRHFLLPRCYFTPFGDILDGINEQLTNMNALCCLDWLQYSFSLQHIISRFSIYTSNIPEHVDYPFGVHVIDILDVLAGMSYDIKCIYNFESNSCTVSAYYYTENIKFLSYMPEINFIKNCQDRYLTPQERLSILKYLLALINLYNGLHGKKEEYDREMQITSHRCIKQMRRNYNENYACRKVVKREYVTPVKIIETYQSKNDNKALLGCRIHLICSMDRAPFNITKSCELLKRDLYLSDAWFYSNSTASPNSNNNCASNQENYAVEIKLQFIVTHKKKEIVDISIKDVDF